MKTYVDTELQPHLLKVLEMADSEKVFASVAMPKLTLKSRSQMKEPLSKLPGLGHIFSDSVDLSRMAREKIKVEGVTHMVNKPIFLKSIAAIETRNTQLKCFLQIYRKFDIQDGSVNVLSVLSNFKHSAGIGLKVE